MEEIELEEIKLKVTARRKRIIKALCLKNDCDMEALFEGKMIDLEVNAAGLDLTDTPEDQEAAVVKLERKAASAKADRDAERAKREAEADAEAAAQQPTTTN